MGRRANNGTRQPQARRSPGLHAFDELRQYLRVRRRGESDVPLAEQQRLFTTRWHSLIAEMAAA